MRARQQVRGPRPLAEGHAPGVRGDVAALLPVPVAVVRVVARLRAPLARLYPDPPLEPAPVVRPGLHDPAGPSALKSIGISSLVENQVWADPEAVSWVFRTDSGDPGRCPDRWMA
ncbi:hypothetical protein IBTHAUMO2_690007 [Nitrosopumilaceae archaeon]|nr:hypothetical protein IBTHAUMO2_690007 [Nitrosopumilaceae archaeon]